jgi:hypothetical protein
VLSVRPPCDPGKSTDECANQERTSDAGKRDSQRSLSTEQHS